VLDPELVAVGIRALLDVVALAAEVLLIIGAVGAIGLGPARSLLAVGEGPLVRDRSRIELLRLSVVRVRG
jgi:hypothetical protein